MSHDGRQLSVSSRLIRHCRKRWADGGLPSLEAFKLRPSELQRDDPYLSFNWLEKICEEAEILIDRDGAIRRLEERPPLDIKPGELWIVLSCMRIEDVILEATGGRPDIAPKPMKCNRSHVSVGGYDVALNCEVATGLAEEVVIEDTHPINKKQDRYCQT